MIGRTTLLALAAGAVALAAPGLAAANPSCGATVKHSVKLTADMTCPSSYGLKVGKSGITINLNGHTITGPTGYTSDYGIYNAGYDKVTLENGTVRNFYTGVFYEYTSGAKIVHVKASGAYYAGISFWYSQKGTIDHSTAAYFGSIGIYLYYNNRVDVTASKSTHSTGYGIYDDYSLSTLDHVSANSNDEEGFYIEEPIVLGKSYYTIEHSSAKDNGYDGFYIEENYPNNVFQVDLLDNTANDNGEYGFYADENAKGKGNHASGNGTANCWHVPCG